MTKLTQGLVAGLVLAMAATAVAKEPVERVKQEPFTSPIHDKHAGKVLAAVTTSDEWHVRLNKYHGQPEHRTVNAVVVVRKKGEERCRAFDLSFRQQYTGQKNKFHKAMELLTGGNVDFPCVNAK